MNSRKKILIAIVAALSTITVGSAIIFTSKIFDKPEHVHSWNEWIETTAPTCTTKGEKRRVCLLDETHVETETLPATGHTEIPHEAKTPTCTEIGWDEYVSCENCDYSTYEELKIDNSNHTFTQGVCACGELQTKGLAFTLSKDGTYYSVGIGTCTEQEIFIPATYNEKPVTTINNGAFVGCESLTSVTIPDSVTTIDNSAFFGCDSLTSVTIGNSVETIGESSFVGCYKLVEVYNKSSLTITVGSEDNGYVGYYAKNIYTPTSGTSKISTDENGYILYTDGDVISLICYTGTDTDLVLPNGITEIYQYAFAICESLTSVTIPDSVTTIDNSAFFGCTSLTSVTIGNSVETIGESSFVGCTSLTNVTIPNSVTTIGESAFLSCTNLTHVTIGDSVTSIAPHVFAVCKSLMNITIGKSVTSIDVYAFDCCYKIVEIYNKSSLKIEKKRFADGVKAVYTEPYTSKLSTDENGYVLYTDGTLVSLIGYIGKEKDLILPQGITEINRYAFYSCDNITSVTIPDSVTSIGQQAFSYCLSLANITVDTNNAVYCSIDGNLYSKTEKSLIQYAIGKEEETFIVPYEVTSIADYAFYSSNLTSVNLNYVTSIGYNAFSSCVFLTEVSFRTTPGYWFAASSKNSSNGWSISSSDLANSLTAANLLKTMYCDYYWTKES